MTAKIYKIGQISIARKAANCSAMNEKKKEAYHVLPQSQPSGRACYSMKQFLDVVKCKWNVAGTVEDICLVPNFTLLVAHLAVEPPLDFSGGFAMQLFRG